MNLSGNILLKSGEEIILSDENLVGNSLRCTMSTCSESYFDIGSFNAATLQLKIFDDEALEHEFDGAVISPYVTIETEDGVITVPIGVYHVDGNKTKRQKNVVQLRAQDASIKFDVAVPEDVKNTSYTPYNAIAKACELAGVTFANLDLSEFPNSLTVFQPSSASVQSLRDLVMWSAQLLCANAIINRFGELEIRKAIYAAEGGAGSSIIADYESNGNDRVSVQFSDVRTFIKYFSAYVGNVPVEYQSEIDPSDAQAREATFSFPKNPLLENASDSVQTTINEASLEYLDTFAPRNIKASMFYNPRLALGSTIRFSGGNIDVRRSIIGVVTGISWSYHGLMTVTCAAPSATKVV